MGFVRDQLKLFWKQFAPASDDKLVVAQFVGVRRRIPFIYALLCINAWSLSYTFHGLASAWLTLCFPAVATIALMARIALAWRGQKVAPDMARRRLTIIEWAAPALGLVFGTWAYLLSKTPVPITHDRLTPHSHIIFCAAATIMPAILLLTPVPRAALRLLMTFMPLFVFFLVLHGTKTEMAVSVNVAFVAISLFLATNLAGRDFEHHIESRHRIREMIADTSRQARTDPVTGVANRRDFFERLTEAAHADRNHCVGLLDLDGFKRINDLYGHTSGDMALMVISQRLNAFARRNGLHFARMGGDEFAFISVRSNPIQLCDMLTQVALHLCREPIDLPRAQVRLDASAGVGTFHNQEGLKSAYNQASYALSQAKLGGRGRVVLFDADQRGRMEHQTLLEQGLRSADFDSEIEVHFQPIYQGDKLELVGFEALARWQRPGWGMVSPSLFIPCAESMGLICDITKAVVRKSFAAACGWPEQLQLKLNLSMLDLSHPHQFEWLVQQVRHAPIAPQRITFEITESMVTEDFALIERTVAQLRALGARIAIDDFGTGYSNLRNVHRLRPDVIKVDQSFIAGLGIEGGTDSIVHTVIELARNIGARTIAEGVETSSQLACLVELGCDEIQGYYFSRPLSQQSALDRANNRPETGDGVRLVA